jgi:hypothetical protein
MDPPECTGHSHDDQGDELGLSLRKYVDIDRGSYKKLLTLRVRGVGNCFKRKV